MTFGKMLMWSMRLPLHIPRLEALLASLSAPSPIAPSHVQEDVAWSYRIITELGRS